MINETEVEFKKYFRASACTSPPWAVFIPPKDRPEVLRLIRQEMLDIYGFSFDECEKRLTCLKKECLGRKLPWKCETAKPYLEAFKENYSTKLNEETGEIELLVSTNCSLCPLSKTCKTPCNQVLDFIERDKVPEPTLVQNSYLENYSASELQIEPSNFLVTGEDIPWDVLSKRKQQVVKKYIYERRDYRYIAETLGLTNQARAKYEFYSALNILSEYATVRSFLKSYKKDLTKKQSLTFELVYEKNLTFSEAAKNLEITKQSVQQMISRTLKKYNITWKSYVRKQNKKTIYNVPTILK